MHCEIRKLMTIATKPALYILAALITISICGCAAPKKPVADTSGLVWPPPPSKPRIKFLRVYRNNLDVERKDMMTKFFGSSGVRSALAFPTSVATNSEGTKIYVAHRFGVALFDLNKRRMRKVATEVKDPRGIAVTPDERVYIIDSASRKIVIYSNKDRKLKEIGLRKLLNPQGIALDMERSRIYVTDAKRYEVYAFDFDGNQLFKFEKVGGAPMAVAVNSKGTVYVTDQIGGRVAVFNYDGEFQYDIGSLGDSYGNFARPKGIAIDSEDNIYVADSAFGNVQIFDKKGKLLTFIGHHGTSLGMLQLPVMMWIDQNDRLYVAERGNHRIQIFQYLSKRYYEKHPNQKPEEAAPEEAAPEEAAPEEAAPEEVAPEEDKPSLSGWD
jgi:DNA-binding beta-propeller fold protein YncE